MESNFRKLLQNILLTDNQEADARTKYNGICEVLHNYYYPNTTYDGRTKLLIGSYGKSTNIRPPRDIDVLFKMPDEEYDRFEQLRGNKQSQLLQEIRVILKDAYTTTEEIRAFGKVVVIQFSEGTHTVELLPAWLLYDNKFRVPDTENGGSWEIFDPISEIKNISNSNKKTGQTIDIIRICKKWAEYCNVEIKSFIIEIIVVDYLNTLNDDLPESGTDKLVRDFFEYLLRQVNTTLIRPTGQSISLGNNWQSKVESALQRADKALSYVESEDFDRASDEWKKIFGDDFPKSESIKIATTEGAVSLLQKQYPSTSEEYLDKTYGIPFRLNSAYKVKIDAHVPEVKGFRAGLLSMLNKMPMFRLIRRMKLSFRIDNSMSRLPVDSEIRWKVRNFGDEARQANDLRGEITVDNGGNEKTENTKYFGNHYVECYVIENKVCVANDNILVPIGNDQ